MKLNALCSVSQGSVLPLLYAGDGDTLYAIDFDSTAADLTGGVVKQVFTGGDDQRRKRAKRLFVEGTGTAAKAQLVLFLDESRSIVVNLTGPYDINENVLFYTEFDPASATFKVAYAALQYIEGENVEVGEIRLDATPID